MYTSRRKKNTSCGVCLMFFICKLLYKKKAGGAHTAQAADVLTQSQPATAPQLLKKKTVSM